MNRLEVERFGDIVESTHSHRSHNLLDILKGSEHNRDNPLIDLESPFQNFIAIHPRQLDIEKDQIRCFLCPLIQSLLPRFMQNDLIPFLLQVLLQGPTNQILIINDQDASFSHLSLHKTHSAQSPSPFPSPHWGEGGGEGVIL